MEVNCNTVLAQSKQLSAITSNKILKKEFGFPCLVVPLVAIRLRRTMGCRPLCIYVSLFPPISTNGVRGTRGPASGICRPTLQTRPSVGTWSRRYARRYAIVFGWCPLFFLLAHAVVTQQYRQPVEQPGQEHIIYICFLYIVHIYTSMHAKLGARDNSSRNPFVPGIEPGHC